MDSLLAALHYTLLLSSRRSQIFSLALWGRLVACGGLVIRLSILAALWGRQSCLRTDFESVQASASSPVNIGHVRAAPQRATTVREWLLISFLTNQFLG